MMGPMFEALVGQTFSMKVSSISLHEIPPAVEIARSRNVWTSASVWAAWGAVVG